MKAVRLLKTQQHAQRLVEAQAEASADREVRHEVAHGLRELGQLRRRGSISEREFLARRERLLQPVVERPVLE